MSIQCHYSRESWKGYIYKRTFVSLLSFFFFPKQQMKILWASRRKGAKIYPPPNIREAKQLWIKIWESKDHIRKGEWINNMEKELQGLEEGLKAKLHLHSLRETLKKYQIGKLQTMMTCMDSSFKNPLHPWHTGYRNELMLRRSRHTRIDDPGKDHRDPEIPSPKRNPPNNYKPMVCLSIMWQILTAQIKE